MQVWCALEFKAFVVFWPCAGLVHFEVQNFCFFLPVQVWWTLKFKTLFFLVPVQVWCNPMHLFIFILILFCIACRYSSHIWHFLLPMQFFEGSGTFFMQRVYNLKKQLILFRAKFWFQEIGIFSFWNVNILKLKSYAFRMHFLLVFAVFLNMWSYWLYCYLVWWPPLQELESALGGWPYIYIYIIYHISFFPSSVTGIRATFKCHVASL